MPLRAVVWLQAVRPKTLSAAVVPVCLGALIASDFASVPWGLFLVTLLFAICIQIGTNLANDVFDCLKGADTDERLGPERVTQAGLVSPSEMKQAVFLVLGLAALLGLCLVYVAGGAMLLIVVLSLVLALAYTSGPLPLAYVGLGDIFVLVFFGPVAVGGTYFVLTRGELVSTALVIGLALGMISTAILVANNLRDVEADTAAGKRTLVVRFGSVFGRVEYVLLLFGAALLPLADRELFSVHPWSFLSLLFLLPALPLMRKVLSSENPKELKPILAQTAGLLLVYAVLFAVGWFV